MSWINPQHLEDASKVLQGAAIVLARAASESPVWKRVGAGGYQQAAQSAMDLMKASAIRTRGVTPDPSIPEPAPTEVPLDATAHASPQAAAGTSQQVQQQSGYHYLSEASSSGATSSKPDGTTRLAAYIFPQTVQQQRSLSVQQLQQLNPAVSGATLSLPLRAHGSQPAKPASVFPSAAPAAPADPLKAALGQAGFDMLPMKPAVSAVIGSVPISPTVAQALKEETHPLPQVQGSMAEAAEPTAAGAAQQPTAAEPAAAAAAPAGQDVTGAAAVAAVQAAQPVSDKATVSASAALQPPAARVLRERAVPSTSIGRALGFAGMGASLLLGSLSDSLTRAISPPKASSSESKTGVYDAFITEANAERLANALCRMRGAALKLGQMLSIQDENVLPPQVQKALERVRQGADVMPRRQLEKVLVSELGHDWHNRVAEFEWQPRAAASIGQVHSAVMHDGRRVAMKIQYPGVARSIESDVDNLMRLISVANILPKGLYVENAVKVAKRELALECDYSYELRSQQRFKALVDSDRDLVAGFNVPGVVPELSSQRVLTSEWVHGVAIDKVAGLAQEVRDDVGSRLLQLTLRELFDWRFMQTDPNWGNFLYDPDTGVIHLIDFGAAKDYPPAFVDDYLRMVRACADRDAAGVVDMSTRLGFLTGDESKVMMEAHTEAGFVVGLPFAAEGVYDFGAHGGMTARVSELGAVMLKHRLTPPPDESYSLHRKLSGAFLACMKLRARVPCRQVFMDAYNRHQFGASGSAAAEAEPQAATA